MKKHFKKPITKEWIELTLCNMTDDIISAMKEDENKKRIMQIIKRYSAEVYNSQ